MPCQPQYPAELYMAAVIEAFTRTIDGGRKQWEWRTGRRDVGRHAAAATARGGSARRVDAGGQLRRDLLLHVVTQHREDLLHERVQLLLE